MTLKTIAASLLTIAELPYAYDALEPYISAETMHFHHDKHYAGYVTKLRDLTEGTQYRGMPLEEVVCCSDGAIFNNAAQALNHRFYFEGLSPRAKHHPTGELRRAIDEQFGSVDELKKRMTAMATTLFGSGWIWLATDSDGKLYILSKPNAGTPLTDGLIALLCIDVWEHAYYLDYQNRRAEHVKRLWEIVDWEVVESRMNI